MIQFIFRQKLRFDLGQSFLSILSFIFILISSGDKLKSFFHLETKTLVFIMVPVSLLLVWSLGYTLDKYLKFMQCYSKEVNDRNLQLNEMLKDIKEIKKHVIFVDDGK